VPEEYLEMKMCERFHCLPHQLREMPEEDFRILSMLMTAEGEAWRLRDKQKAHYGR
jgi:hypothetical protein